MTPDIVRPRPSSGEHPKADMCNAYVHTTGEYGDIEPFARSYVDTVGKNTDDRTGKEENPRKEDSNLTPSNARDVVH